MWFKQDERHKSLHNLPLNFSEEVTFYVAEMERAKEIGVGWIEVISKPLKYIVW